MLGSCALEEDTTPDWSWLGVALMLGLLAALLLLLEYARVSGRSNRSAQSLEDDVMHLVEAVGFKVRTWHYTCGYQGGCCGLCPSHFCVSPGHRQKVQQHVLQLPRNCLLTDSTPACLQVLHGSMGAARQQAQHDPQHWPHLYVLKPA